MAVTFFDFTATAGQTVFPISFSFLKEEFIKVNQDGVAITTFTVINGGADVKLDTGAGAGQIIRVFRSSDPLNKLVTFQAASVKKASDLNTSVCQLFDLVQEVQDDADAEGLKKDFQGNWDGQGLEAKNFADPTSATSLATKQYADGIVAGSGNVPAPTDPGDDFKLLRAENGVFTWGSEILAKATVVEIVSRDVLLDNTKKLQIEDFTATARTVATVDGSSVLQLGDAAIAVRISGLTGLTVVGGSLTVDSGDVVLPNAKSLKGRDNADSADIALAGINASDIVQLGDVAGGSSTGNTDIYRDGVKKLSIGLAQAQLAASTLRLDNAKAYVGRNSIDTADLEIAQITAANRVQIGDLGANLDLVANNLEFVASSILQDGIDIELVKAWLRFDVAAGVPTIKDSRNISSITDLGVGLFEANLDMTMASAFEPTVGSSYDSGGGRILNARMKPADLTKVEISLTNDAGTLVDADGNSLIVLGATT